MSIEIRLEKTQPPTGEVCTERFGSRPFLGWLQLLQILVELVDLPDDGRQFGGRT